MSRYGFVNVPSNRRPNETLTPAELWLCSRLAIIHRGQHQAPHLSGTVRLEIAPVTQPQLDVFLFLSHPSALTFRLTGNKQLIAPVNKFCQDFELFHSHVVKIDLILNFHATCNKFLNANIKKHRSALHQNGRSSSPISICGISGEENGTGVVLGSGLNSAESGAAAEAFCPSRLLSPK